jgi:hypothetical protein
MENSLEFSVPNVMKMQYFMQKMNKMLVANLNRHSQKIIDSYFQSVIYGEDIIKGLYVIFISILSDVVSRFFNSNVFSYLCIFILYIDWHFILK